MSLEDRLRRLRAMERIRRGLDADAEKVREKFLRSIRDQAEIRREFEGRVVSVGAKDFIDTDGEEVVEAPELPAKEKWR